MTAILTILLGVLFGAASPAMAATVLGDDEVSVSKNIDDDVYIFGGDVTVSGNIGGDLIVMGGSVRVTGKVEGDLMIAGGQITVDGPVGDTVRIGGGMIEINSTVKKDVLVASGTLTLGPKSAVGGDLVAGAGNVETKGSVRDDIRGSFGTAKLEGKTGGDVKVTVEQLTVAKSARIRGDLTYTSAQEARIDYDADVGGQVKRLKPPKPRGPSIGLILLDWFWSLMGMIATALVAAWIFPRTLTTTRDALVRRPGASIGVGFAILLLTPPAAVLLAIFTLGFALPVSLLAITAYVVGIYLAQVYAATALGSWIVSKAAGKEKWIGAGAVVGIVGLGLVRLIPFLGGLIGFLLIISGLGAMALALVDSRRKRDDKGATPEEPPVDA